ncbi:glycosyltransferase, group 2 family protein [Leptotrichia wadei]|jgi:Glycosyltransferases, probably involved in cell wall biogenesis|uniref:Glycosyl transferase family 2 n=1 Tax=Leptotrichia wadei TaxID=157687 RepID=A0A134A2A5_9FUSO|nr:glycosyltransferase family 2 protein [Leptotrichia wadei]KXB61815.1 glycosyltransferase, group 2 family protein [Leptotrichia wadei]BBM46677.1 glycosyl transferase family 2 [Leptotrichia wadei]
MIENKKIDILMATYNGEKYLAEQIDSIICQTYKNWNLLIRDDGSSDNTFKILKEYEKKDDRIKIIKDKKGNLGIAKNFEELLKISSSELIMFSDQDDVWKKDKIKIMLKYVGNSDLIISDAIVTNEKLECISESLFCLVKSKNGIIKNVIKNTYYGCCMLFKRKILEEVLPIPNNKEIGHDLWIGLISEKYYKVKFIDEKLIYFRRHSNNVTTINKSKRNIRKKIIGRYIILKELFRRYKKLKK